MQQSTESAADGQTHIRPRAENRVRGSLPDDALLFLARVAADRAFHYICSEAARAGR